MIPARPSLLLALALSATAAGVCRGQQMAGAPFVDRVKMTVLDPAAHDPALADLRTIDALAQDADGRVVAAAALGDGSLVILVLAGEPLEFVLVLRPDDVPAGWSWRGLVDMGERGIGAVCFADAPADGRDDVPGRLLTIRPKSEAIDAADELSLPERPAALAYLPDRRQLVGLTAPSNAFFVLDPVDDEGTVTRVLFDFVPHEYPPGEAILVARNGIVYGSYKGRLFGRDPEREGFDYLGHLPCEFGHLSEAALSAIAEGADGLIAGGIRGDGYLFTFDPETRKLTPRGRPSDATRIRCLVHAGETGFWGFAQTPGQPGRLFRLDPADGTLEDLGIPMGTLKRGERTWRWHAYSIGAMLSLRDGRILLAEDARQAKLLVFDPQPPGRGEPANGGARR